MNNYDIVLNNEEWNRLYSDATHPNMDAINRRERFLSREDLADWTQDGDAFVLDLPDELSPHRSVFYACSATTYNWISISKTKRYNAQYYEQQMLNSDKDDPGFFFEGFCRSDIKYIINNDDRTEVFYDNSSLCA